MKNNAYYVEKYRKIADELIKKSFSILKNKLIFIFEKKDKKLYYGISYDFVLFKHIGIFKRSRKHSKKALKGLLAHELSHLENSTKMGFYRKIIYFAKWFFSKQTKAEYETMADILLVKKGYGREYSQFLTESLKGKNKEYLKRREERGYLSLKKVKEYMKKQKSTIK